jgi:glutamate-1-semialdehyde aminotransferase
VFSVHWAEHEPQNAKDTAKAFHSAGVLPALFHLEMMNRGIHIAPRGMFALSTPMTENDVNGVIKTFEDTLKYLKPFVENQLPQLLQN